MTRTAMLVALSLGAILASRLPAAGGPPGVKPSAKEQKPSEKQELGEEDISRIYERARRAQAHCDLQQAAVEWRKILRLRENCLKRVKALCARGVCCSVEEFRNAEGAVAVARARLAEVEGRKGDLQAELPRVIVYYEARIKEIQTLLDHKAIAEKDAQTIVKELREELSWARKRLASLKGDNPSGQDPMTADKQAGLERR